MNGCDKLYWENDTRYAMNIEEFSCNTIEESIEFRIILDYKAVLFVIDRRSRWTIYLILKNYELFILYVICFLNDNLS